MASSEEYLARFGVSTDDIDKAVDQTITLLGHLGNVYDDLAPKAERASRALTGSAAASRQNAAALKEETNALKGWTSSMTQRLRLIQEGERKAAAFGAGTLAQTPNERRFENFIAQGASNDAYAASSAARKRALADETTSTQKAAQARNDLAAEIRGEETARRAELAALRSAIQGRYAESDAIQAQGQNLARLRYAIYDVSNALAIGGLGAAAFVAGVVGTSVKFEREFAGVRRTVGVTGEAADQLYLKFLKLSTEIPVAFSSLTEIGTLAGQLGIAESRVASFTRTTAEFAATTDVSVEASATAFGRLDQLIDGVNGQYANLASSILNVGINSVATESQIIAIASQIAATGNQAKLSADEIIGLSGSLASLGIAPEAARGTILRVFSQINAAISQGGEALNDFATISGMTSDEFRQGWSTDFTSTFLAFLEGVNENGSSAEEAIRALGITATRDVNALLKLSQNTDAVANNLALASNGFSDASILAENFGIIAETNSAKLQTLIQTVQAFAASVGEATSGPLSYFLDYLQRVLDGLIAFSRTDVGQGISFFATALGAVLAVMLLVTAAGLRVAGSVLAIKTAMGDAAVQTALATNGLKGFTLTLFGAAGAAKAFGAALKGTGIGLLISGGLYLLGEAIAAIGNAMQSGREKAESYFGSLDGLSDAIKADNADLFANRVAAANEEFNKGTDKAQSWVDVLENAARIQQQLKDSVDEAGNAVDNQTLRIGENTQQWLRNALATSEGFTSLFDNLDDLKALTGSSSFTAGEFTVDYKAFDLEEFVRIASTRGGAAAERFYESWKYGLEQKFSEAGADPTFLDDLVEISTSGSPERDRKIRDAAQSIGDAMQAGLEDATRSGAQNALLDAVLGPLDDGGAAASEAFASLMDDIFGVINAQEELRQNTIALGKDFAENGSQVASTGAAMQAVIASIYASSSGSAEAAARLQGLFDALVAGGYASVQQLLPLQAIIAQLSGGKAVKGTPFDMSGFSKGISKVAGGAAKQIKTLVDYANDLGGVFDRAFDIRFGGVQALDDVTSGWNRIRDAVAETNEEIAKYQADMQQLTADKSVREYWLMVAENYGDALRAGELRAELADINNQLASTQSDLNKAQQKGSKTLVGNSQAAIDNRAEVLGMVQSYQDYIQALAAAGVPQAKLQEMAAKMRSDFINQAVALGYNSSELGVYARAFDDVSVAIAKVPRNINVKFNGDPALQALNEFMAKVRSAVGGGVQVPVSVVPDTSGAAASLRAVRDTYVAQLDAAYRAAGGNSNLNTARLEQAILRLNQQLALMGYRSGTAWTGSGNPWDIAGFVHNREAVLNERGTRAVGPQFVNAANQGRDPWQYAPQTSTKLSMPGRFVVELSPIDRDLLAQGKQVTVVIDAEKVGAASSSSFSDDDHRGAS